MITIIDIIISEQDKPVNEVLLHSKDVFIRINRNKINFIREQIIRNHPLANKNDINVCFLYREESK